MPPFGFGDDQISIFAEIPDVVLPRKQRASSAPFFFMSSFLSRLASASPPIHPSFLIFSPKC